MTTADGEYTRGTTVVEYAGMVHRFASDDLWGVVLVRRVGGGGVCAS